MVSSRVCLTLAEVLLLASGGALWGQVNNAAAHQPARGPATARLADSADPEQEENTSQDPELSAPAPRRPDIRDPGPDFGSLPNGPGTVRPGRVYLETSVAGGMGSIDSLSTPFLLRVGLVEHLEFRFLGDGLNYQHNSDDTTGYAPLTIGFKLHVWEGQGPLIPAFGIEPLVQIPSGSGAFSSDRWLPTVSLNFAHTLSDEWSFAWNFLLGAGADDDDDYFFQGGLLYALTYNLNEDFNVFIDGEYTEPSGDGGGSIGVVGAGFQWILNDRIALSSKCGLGLTDDASDVSADVALTFAF